MGIYVRDISLAATSPSLPTLSTPEITSPVNGATMTGRTQLFEWTNPNGAYEFDLWIGSTRPNFADPYGTPNRGREYYNATGLKSTTSDLVTALANDGSDMHVTLFYRETGVTVGFGANYHTVDIIAYLDATVTLNTLYVATNGNDSNDGLTEANALRTIQEGVDRAAPGTKVLVAAGDYGAEKIIFSTNGLATNKIVVEGYNPDGEVRNANTYEAGSTFDGTRPVLTNTDRGNGATAFDINSDYVCVLNFDIMFYEVGFNTSGSDYNEIVNNIYAFGGWNDEYAGYGIVTNGTEGATWVNNTIYNAGAQGITVSHGSYVAQNRVICDEDGVGAGVGTATDYYYVIDGSNNRIVNNETLRIGNLKHGGHGYTVKGTAGNPDTANNVFDGNLSNNTKGIQFWGSNCHSNICRNHTHVNGWAGIEVRTGAHDNLVEDFTINGGLDGIDIFDHPASQNSTIYSSLNNTFRRVAINNVTRVAISFHDYTNTAAIAAGNIFEDITVNNCPALFDINHDVLESNTFENLAINNVPVKIRSGENGGSYELNNGSFSNVTITPAAFTLP